MAVLENTGTCKYNGVTFDALYKSKVSAKPVLDDARRTTVAVDHTLEVQGYIAAAFGIGATTDLTLEEMRKQLTACGGKLEYEDKGYGSLTVNDASVRDAAWGPIPEILEWIPIGNDVAAKVTWRVTTRIPECDAARYRFALMAVNYEVDFEIDKEGYTRITTSGYLEIPMTRITHGLRSLPDTADNYYNLIVPEIPLGYQRQHSHRHTSKDKRRLDFSFEDMSLPCALPDGLTECNIRQTVDSSLKVGMFEIWTITFDATMKVAHGLGKGIAADRFFRVVGSRLGKLPRSKFAIPQSFSATDDIFGKDIGFRHVVSVFAVHRNDILAQTGMWSPVPGTGFGQWRQSLQSTVANPNGRGADGAAELASNDTIIDLCTTKRPVQTVPASNILGGLQPDPDSLRIPLVPNMTEDNSWMLYLTYIRAKRTNRKAVLKPLPNRKPIDAPAPSRPGKDLIGPPQKADIVQNQANPDRRIIFGGVILRCDFRIPAPALVSFQGLQVEEADRDVTESVVTSLGGIPVFCLVFRIEYIVPDAPTATLPFPDNPYLEVSGGTGEAVLRAVGG